MSDRVVFTCSCEGTVPLDARALGERCGGSLHTADQLCRRELDRVRAALETGAPVTVSCTQEAPLFGEIAAEMEAQGRVRFVNIRENAGWSNEGAKAAPKIAALLAAAAQELPPVPTVTMESRGVALIYGRDETAIEAGRRLADHLDVTVLLAKPGDVAPPRATAFPVLKGVVTAAQGHLGAFKLRVDDYAAPLPSSRERLVFAEARNGASSSCDVIVDLTGRAPLFSAHELRSGYLRADPRDPAAVERALFAASHLVGEFEKPRFIDFDAKLCAHSRSGITGCTRCLDVCPAGAIAPAGDHVALDPFVCAGCGGCAAVCPTGAESYALPPVEALLGRLRILLTGYREAGGENPVLLLHDGEHGEPLIDALARFGAGLPANVIPVRVNEITALGPEVFAAAFAQGAAGAHVLSRAKPKHDLAPTHGVLGLADAALAALGYGAGLVSIIETDDPDALRSALDGVPLGRVSPQPSLLAVTGRKRKALESAFTDLHRAAPAPVDLVPLAAGAPFGGLDVDVDGCTLCLSCVGACPTGALSDDPDRPMLKFKENLCVQCGLCAATCPERVIALKPQIDFPAWEAPRRVVKEEAPFRCTACSKPFGTRSTIERVIAKLQGRHWMFSGAEGEARARVLTMCEDCRVEAVVNENFDPHTPQRPRPRTAQHLPAPDN